MNEAQRFPSDAGADVFLLTVRGTPTTDAVEVARDLHNATAGDPNSVAGAKSLGDLSHNVFRPAEQGELRLMFIDSWNSPSGVGQFFGNPQVAEAADKLFAERQATLWAPAPGFGSYTLPVPSGRSVAGVGYLRVPLTSLDDAGPAFHAHAAAGINRARMAGQVAHQMWLPVPMPGAEPTVEVLGIDYWLDVSQMIDYYNRGDFSQVAPVFAAAPESDTWRSAGADWVEW
jgi:hypothetical protein